MKAQSDILFLSIQLTTLEVIQSSVDIPEHTFFEAFFKLHLSEDVLGKMEQEYNYETILSYIKENKDQVVVFFNENRSIGYRFVFHSFSHEEGIAYLSIEPFVGNQENIYLYYRDVLTGLVNRSKFIELVESILKNDTSYPVALFMIDLNNFKYVNDRFGHRFGDNCLRQYAAILKEIAGNNYLARYGGDEFVLLIENATLETIKKISDQIINSSYTFRVGTQKVTIDCCCGVTLHEEHNLTFSYLIELADKALYRAKKRGKIYVFLDRKVIAERNKKAKRISKTSFSKSTLLFKEEIQRLKRLCILVSVGLICVLSAFTVYFSVLIERKIREETRTEALTTMEMISRQMESNVSNNINSWFSQLTIVSEMISNYGAELTRSGDLNSYLSLIKEQVSFDNIALLYENGNLYFSDGIEYNISFEDITNHIILNQENYIDNISLQYLGDTYIGEAIIFGIPHIQQHQIDKNLTEIRGICGLIRPETLASYLSVDAFNNSTSVSLVKESGFEIVRHTPLQESPFPSKNFLNSLEECLGAEQYEEAKNNFKDGNTQVISYPYKNKDYLAYSSLFNLSITSDTFDPWRIVISVPMENINQNITKIINEIYLLLITAELFFLVSTIALLVLQSMHAIKRNLFFYTEPLTHGINMARFEIDANKLINTQKDKYALVYLNFLKFKYLNEQLGKDDSDQVIIKTFEIIEDVLKSNELVSRNYADRFMLLMAYQDEEQLKQRIVKLKETIEIFVSEKYRINTHILVGIYQLDEFNDNLSYAFDKVRIALQSIGDNYYINPIGFYRESMLVNELSSNELEQKAKISLEEGNFIVYYQAKRDILEDKWSSAEALVRWKDPENGMISPGKFVPLFEKNGFIIELDLYVFERVCQDIRDSLNKKQKVLPVSVNLSRKHLVINDFLSEYEKRMQKYNIPARYIEFEITESMFLDNTQELLKVIDRIHLMGCTCSIDDFGSGYSSLTMIRDFPFDTIKLDRRFFYGKNGLDDKSKKIIQTIIKLSRDLNKNVVAEGIEMLEQVQFLKSVQCQNVQGYYFSKPMPYNDYIDLVKEDKLQ